MIKHLLIFVCLGLSLGISFGQFAGGSGTVDNPYKIETCTHFQNINDWSNPASGLNYFLLENDINCTSEGNDIMLGGAGETSTQNMLHFDGGTHTISYDINLPVDKSNPVNVGLFRSLTGSTIENLNVSGSIVSHNKVGGIVGHLQHSHLNNISASVSVTGNQQVGGIVGDVMRSEIHNTSFVGTVYGFGDYIGGIVGDGSIVQIHTSNSSGTVFSESNYVGGLIGAATEPRIYDSYNTSTISGYDDVGGLAGFFISLGRWFPDRGVLDSYNAGDVFGNNRVGGIVGASMADVILKNCYNIGDIHGSSYVGGIVGDNADWSVIENCYNAGIVNGGDIVGGLFGNPGNFQNIYSFWDTLDGNNPTEGTVGSGLSTDSMKQLSTYLDADWDIAGLPDTNINNGYPFLGWQLGFDDNTWYISTTLGCIDPEANNFNQLATQDDESCTYGIQGVQPSKGGGGSVLVMDDCPDGDFSGSYYDGTCGKIQMQHQTKDKEDDTTDSQSQEDKETQKDSSVSTDKTMIEDVCATNDEYKTAYDFAYKNKITTQICDETNMDTVLIRAHAAKMMSNYAMNVLDRQPDTKKKCLFDDIDSQSEEIQQYIIIACQLGLMGLESDGITPATSFNPTIPLNKAQLATILSRMMYGPMHDNNEEGFWVGHVQAMQEVGIITITTDLFDPLKRAYALLMLMRTITVE